MRSTLVTLASFIAVANAEIALYWGQNAAGGQETLRHYCENSPSDIVLLSFLNQYPNTQVNFANQCGATFSDGLLHCPQIGEDITACQAMGKQVLLTLGGAVGPYGFSSDAEGALYAHTLNDMFGPVNPLSGANRPFDNAVIDGYNLDPEEGSASPNTALAKELKSINSATKLAAAPQCVYPDQYVGDALLNAAFDYVFVQFYNNYCDLDKDFNWNTWSDYAKNVSPNKNVKIFVGLPGSTAAAGTGYVSADYVKSKLSIFENDPAFGGFAIWDASASEANSNYAQQLIDISKPAPVSSSSSSTVAPVTSASTSNTAAPVASVEHSSALYGNSSVAVTSLASTSMSTELVTHQTVITVTNCDELVCTAQPVTTGYVVITSAETEYTTYCPLSSEEAAHTSPATKAASTSVATAPATKENTEAVSPSSAPAAKENTETASPSSAPATKENTEAASPSSAPAIKENTEAASSALTSFAPIATESPMIKVNSDNTTSTISTVVYVTAFASSSASVFEAGAGANKFGLGAALIAGVALLL